MQFLLSQSVKSTNKNAFITLEENPDELRKRMSAIELDLSSAEKSSRLLILDASMSRIGLPSSEPSESVLPKEFSIDQLAARLFELRLQPQKLVFDSLSALEFEKIPIDNIRKNIHKLFRLIKSLGCTSVFTSEIYSNSSGLSRFGVEEYLADGLIQVKIEDIEGQLERWLVVRKMRGTNHSLKWHRFSIGRGGITIVERE